MTTQLICALTAVISATSLFILSGIVKRIERLENLFLSKGLQIWEDHGAPERRDLSREGI